MKSTPITAVASLLAVLAFSAPALAQDATDDTTTGSTASSPLDDETGFAVFGIDIGPAGASPETVQQFVAGLSAEQQSGINATCQSLRDGANTASVHANVTTFCQNLLGS